MKVRECVYYETIYHHYKPHTSSMYIAYPPMLNLK